MEVLAPVSFDASEVRRIVKKTGACLIWGGGLAIAPADDLIIRVSRPLSLEPYDKMIVSIMAKKVAMGVKTLVIDMPIGDLTKIPDRRTANTLAKKFVWLGRQFGMRVQVEILEAEEPVGRGVGPALEARDVLRVLQQKSLRPMDLEEKSIHLAGVLLELSGKTRAGHGEALARSALQSGAAWKQMQRIIAAQGGNPRIDSDTITLSAFTRRVAADKSGRVVHVNNRSVDEVARTLGAPSHKLAGVYLHHRVGERVKKGDKLFTLYARSADRLQLAEHACRRNPLLTIR
jgi:AMP phosphorylase